MMPAFASLPRSVMPSCRAVFAFPLAAFAVLGNGAAVAAEPARSSTAGKPAERAILTPAQLRECLGEKERLQAQNDAATKGKAELVAGKAELDRSEAALAEQLATLDRTSADAVAAYNAKVEQRNSMIGAHEGKVAAYNKEVDNVSTARDAYEKSCQNRRYDERDLEDLKRRK